MDNYITGTMIKKLRERRGLTQLQLAEKLSVSDKTISKWETAKGFPDSSMIEPIAKVLGVSITELFTGDIIINKNVSANMLKTKLYVCPLCGNIITACGNAAISCCGIHLPALELELCDQEHRFEITSVEDEYFITISHSMTKSHYISFLALLTSDRMEMIKLYPEGNAQARFKMKKSGLLIGYCNKHGLFYEKLKK